jgi:hypothetical protein
MQVIVCSRRLHVDKHSLSELPFSSSLYYLIQFHITQETHIKTQDHGWGTNGPANPEAAMGGKPIDRISFYLSVLTV